MPVILGAQGGAGNGVTGSVCAEYSESPNSDMACTRKIYFLFAFILVAVATVTCGGMRPNSTHFCEAHEAAEEVTGWHMYSTS
jgi:hypothetical protein